MKNMYLLFLLSLIFTVNNGCSKEKLSENYLRGKIDGVAFECSSNFWATTGNAGDKIISFRGNWASGSVSFYLDGQGTDISPGNYPFVTGIQRNTTLYEGSDAYGAGFFFCLGPCQLQGSGEISISAIDKKHIRGVFQFTTAVNPNTGFFKTVTGGEFYIRRD